MMTDPIADMLTRIRNAQRARLPEVRIPYSKLKMEIAQLLNREGFVGAVEKTEDPAVAAASVLSLALKYNGREPVIQSLKRESKPGHRQYLKAQELPRVLNDFGIAIVSTSRGLMTNKEAKKLGIGGEVICSVY